MQIDTAGSAIAMQNAHSSLAHPFPGMSATRPAAFHPHALPTRARRHNRTRATLCTRPPSTYEELQTAAATATQAALTANCKLIELQFPPVTNMATAALNELLDANRSHARAIIRPFIPRYPAQDIHMVFPDVAEARLARNAFGDTPFCIRAIPNVPPAYLARPKGLVVVVQPGFNVSEWIDMQNLRGQLPIVTVNADLDKVRGNYYPRLFYPGLHRASENFLSSFEETYYLKMFSNGGVLMRVFPGAWRLFYTDLQGTRSVIWEGDHRPGFPDVERMLALRRQNDLLAR